MNVSQRPPRGQFLLIDLLKALAAQIIVFHHLSIYGPISVQALSESNVVAWLSEYGRYAVQIFLVLGGYLAMMTLPNALQKTDFLKVLINRYLRLIPTFIVVIVLTTIVALYARSYLSEELVGSPVTFFQIISHALLLHGVLSVESISAGVWYIAIDWQLYGLLASLLVFFKKSRVLLITLFFLMLGGFFYFSKYEQYDVWMVYFIGSYGLGVIAFLASDSHDLGLRKLANLIAYFMVLLLLISYWHGAGAKALVALITFSALLLSKLSLISLDLNKHSYWIEFVRWFSHRSYCLFLIHYPFILIFNALFEGYGLARYNVPILLMLGVWGVSILAANYLYQFIEKPCRRWQLR